MTTKKDFFELVLQKGCYSKEENLRIYNKFFKNAPRYLFRAVDKKYNISKKILCDVGCSYGQNLLYCSDGSYGIEVIHGYASFARSLGLNVYQRNAVADSLADLPKVEVIWCSALLEHVDSPHVLLRRMHNMLSPGGLICVYVPTISLLAFLRKMPVIGKHFSGYIHADHINAFSAKTLRFTCERAGFETYEVSPFYPPPLNFLNFIPLIDGIVYIGKKIENWDYPKNSARKATTNSVGYVF